MSNMHNCGRHRREMTEDERQYVIAVEKGEISFNEMRRKIKVSCSTLYRWIDEVRLEEKQ